MNPLIKNNNGKDALTGEEFSSLINSKNFNNFLCINGSFFYLVMDVSTMMYQYVSPGVKHVLGYSQDVFMEKGAAIVFDNYHPEICNTLLAINEECFSFLAEKPAKMRFNYKFSFDMLVRNNNGEYVRLIQHNRIIKLNKKGEPALMLSICIKVPAFKNEIKQTLFISKISPNSEKVISKKDFYPHFENGLLTKTEIEVWKLITDGFTGKEIAEKMGNKVNTVNTHRKNIYKKLRDKSVQN